MRPAPLLIALAATAASAQDYQPRETFAPFDMAQPINRYRSANGLPVPDDLAVLCAEHESVMNSLAPVPMSNIDQSPLRVGREAAALLDRLMSGRRAPHSGQRALCANTLRWALVVALSVLEGDRLSQYPISSVHPDF